MKREHHHRLLEHLPYWKRQQEKGGRFATSVSRTTHRSTHSFSWTIAPKAKKKPSQTERLCGHPQLPDGRRGQIRYRRDHEL